MVSIPNSVRVCVYKWAVITFLTCDVTQSAEVGSEFIQQPPAALSVLKQSSLEENAAPAEVRMPMCPVFRGFTALL